MDKPKQVRKLVNKLATHLQDEIGSLNWMLSSGKIHTQSDDNMFSDGERAKLTQLRNDLKSARKKLFQ